MASSTPVVITFPAVQNTTTAGANAKQKALVTDALKQNLSILNARLAARQTPEPPVTLAAIDAANNTTLLRWMTIILKEFVHSSAIAWRATLASQAAAAPIIAALPEMDEVP